MVPFVISTKSCRNNTIKEINQKEKTNTSLVLIKNTWFWYHFYKTFYSKKRVKVWYFKKIDHNCFLYIIFKYNLKTYWKSTNKKTPKAYKSIKHPSILLFVSGLIIAFQVFPKINIILVYFDGVLLNLMIKAYNFML